MGDGTTGLLAALATYAVHSTLLLGLAWLATARLVRSPRAREVLWRTAFLGALLTAGLQTAFGSPLVETRLPDMARARRTAAPAPLAEPSPPRTAPAAAAATPRADPLALAPPSVPARQAPSPAPSLGDVLLGAWWLGALLLLARRQIGWHRFRRRVRARTPAGAAATLRVLRALETEAGLRRPVRLTTAPDLASPVAMGVLCPEICLPARTLSDLSPEQVEALLAHEVWHVRRRDALWLAVQGWIAALFFFQPLNALAQRRLRETAEVLCDDGAVSSKDRRLALAECLARIADWTLRPLPALVPAMAEPASLLGRRLRRLLRPPAAGRSQRGGPAGLFAAASLAAVLAFAPGVRSAPSTPPPVPVETPSTPLGALDASLGALERDVRHVRTLLRRAGHPDLARRLARRLEALGARRDDLRYRLGDPGDER